MMATSPDILTRVIALHTEATRIVRGIESRLGDRLHCGAGCAMCCCDDLTVFEIEADRIRAEFPAVLTQSPGPTGSCAFLDDAGRCRVYEARPYVCRTQGPPLRWFDETDEGEMVEFRDICPLNEEGELITDLPDADCFFLGPFEERLRALQRAASGDLRRVALRDLFKTR